MQSSVWRRALLINIVLWMLLAPYAATSYSHTHRQMPPVWPLPEDPVEARKARLINALLPHIHASNDDLLALRERLQQLQARYADKDRLGNRDTRWLNEQRTTYRIPEALDTADALDLLIRRVDVIPADLALAQAAMESAWGQSRFARQGNNYFGQWCFTRGCGMVPSQRGSGKRHEVARFATPRESVDAYMLNLNTHPRYTELRQQRAAQRGRAEYPDGYALAGGLNGYSAIGQQYVRALRGLIRGNDLERFRRDQGSGYH